VKRLDPLRMEKDLLQNPLNEMPFKPNIKNKVYNLLNRQRKEFFNENSILS
jgi:hypothetical protein